MAGLRTLAAVVAFLVIAGFIGAGEAAVALQEPLKKPDKYADECGCYSEILDVVLLTNVDVNPIDGVHCRRFRCQENGNTAIETCGVVAVRDPECRTTSDLSKPYPGCCPTPVCPKKG